MSAVIECADAAHGLGGRICADGGCTSPGDVAKAFGGGADFVMLGGMFAGHDECAGDIVERDGKKFKRFYGMSCRTAMEKYAGGVANYRASEGKEVLVPYRGPVADTLQDILGGVRSACTYVGARMLKETHQAHDFRARGHADERGLLRGNEPFMFEYLSRTALVCARSRRHFEKVSTRRGGLPISARRPSSAMMCTKLSSACSIGGMPKLAAV